MIHTKRLATPYIVWMVLFTVVPLGIVFYYAFTDSITGQFTLENIIRIQSYMPIFIKSIWLALISTLVCLIIGYPVAYYIAQCPPSRQRLLYLLVMLPMCISFLLRTMAWVSLLDDTGIWAAVIIVFTFTAGSVFLMWLGEQITEHGVGNGISIILFAGIVSRMPFMVRYIYNAVRNHISGVDTSEWTEAQLANYHTLNPVVAALLVVGILALVVLVVFIYLSERRVPVQYAKKVVGRKSYGGQSTHIPMKVNMSGVLPIIFAQSLIMLPATIAMFVPSSRVEGTGWYNFVKAFNSTSVIYAVIYFALIIAFSYFYATIQFNPTEVANNLKRNGGFIPGFRPGKPTADVLAGILSRITFFGAIFLGVVAIMPIVFERVTGFTNLGIGGTSVIIVVGVALETVKQIEAQMIMRHYKGFLE